MKTDMTYAEKATDQNEMFQTRLSRGTPIEQPLRTAAGTSRGLRVTRGSRLPLGGVLRLWIGIGSLWNLDGARRIPAGRGRRVVSARVPLIRKEWRCYAQGFDLRLTLHNVV